MKKSEEQTSNRSGKAHKPEAPIPAGQERAGYVKPPSEQQIDEAADESFPASDPPSFTGATASPSEKTPPKKEPQPDPDASA